MKLRNKETREIGRLAKTKTDDDEIEIITDTKVYLYNSISEVCQHWEDYEEPKGYYYVTTTGLIKYDDTPFCAIHKDRKEICNYFLSREEAEKAVEKLKAWKRLKDIGYSFDGWSVKSASSDGDHLIINLYVKDCTGCEELLDLLFGGKE